MTPRSTTIVVLKYESLAKAIPAGGAQNALPLLSRLDYDPPSAALDKRTRCSMPDDEEKVRPRLLVEVSVRPVEELVRLGPATIRPAASEKLVVTIDSSTGDVIEKLCALLDDLKKPPAIPTPRPAKAHSSSKRRNGATAKRRAR